MIKKMTIEEFNALVDSRENLIKSINLALTLLEDGAPNQAHYCLTESLRKVGALDEKISV